MEEGEYEQEENSRGVAATDNPMEEMVGAIEETEGETTEEMERGTVAKEATMETRDVNVEGEEGKVTKTEEISSQVVNIETSSDIKGTAIEEEEPLAETGEVSTFLTPQRKRKILSTGG